jgi:hypothetical protein
MTEIRPIPGFPGYYAGDDGRVYRRFEGHIASGTNGRLYLNIQIDGVQHRHPLAWWIARAWLGEAPDGMVVRFKSDDASDTSPGNLEYAPSYRMLPKEHAREADRRMREKLEADPHDPRHGTRTGYRYGCKCERCRAMGPVVNRMNQTKRLLKEVRDGECGRCDGERAAQ